MIRFTDGPAAGVVLELARAPLYLRVVAGPGHCGEFDALDLPADVPAADETVTVYRRVGEAGSVHLDYTDRRTGRRRGRTYATATYALAGEQPDDATARDTARWRAWCERQAAKEKEEQKG